MIMDEVVGNITQAFKMKQMWDNTLVVMSSDNVRLPQPVKEEYSAVDVPQVVSHPKISAAPGRAGRPG